MISYNGRLLKVVVTSTSTMLQDFQTPYSYCGIADVGSVENNNVWKITRIEVFMDGTILSKVATNVAWSDRYSITYN